MAQGHIHKLSDRGFGFIRPVDGRKDLFFHARQVVGVSFDELQEGDSVSYTPADDPQGKGPIATEVERTLRVVRPDDAMPPHRQVVADPSVRRDETDDVTDYDWGAAS